MDEVMVSDAVVSGVAANKLPTVDASIYPRGGLDVLSRDEVMRLRDASSDRCATIWWPWRSKSTQRSALRPSGQPRRSP